MNLKSNLFILPITHRDTRKEKKKQEITNYVIKYIHQFHLYMRSDVKKGKLT